jgi:hypothetical protein
MFSPDSVELTYHSKKTASGQCYPRLRTFGVTQKTVKVCPSIKRVCDSKAGRDEKKIETIGAISHCASIPM